MFLKKPVNKISTWVLWAPMKFAIISMMAMMACIAIYTSINPNASQYEIPIVMICALLMIIIFHIWRLPADDISRRQFVALNTAQMFITNMLFIIMTIGILQYVGALEANMITLPQKNPLVTVAITTVGLMYLYQLGVSVGNLYAKYRRVRTMGVNAWKIICTIPFGFSMLWIAGYMLPDAKPTKTKSTGRYARIINAICNNNIYAYTAIVLLIMTSGLFTGINVMATALTMCVIFAMWLRTRGTTITRADIPYNYSTTAIVINIVMIATGMLSALL